MLTVYWMIWRHNLKRIFTWRPPSILFYVLALAQALSLWTMVAAHTFLDSSTLSNFILSVNRTGDDVLQHLLTLFRVIIVAPAQEVWWEDPSVCFYNRHSIYA